MNVFLILVAFCVFVFTLRWRIIQLVGAFVGMLCILCAGFVIDLAWWISLYRNHFASADDRAVIEMVTEVSTIATFFVLLVMSLNWILAFHFLVAGAQMDIRREKLLKIVVGICSIVLCCFVVGFGIAALVYGRVFGGNRFVDKGLFGIGVR